MTNRSLWEPAKVKLDWGGLKRAKTVTARQLASDNPAAYNTAEVPEAVKVEPVKITPAKAERGFEIPAMSVTAVEVEV